MKRKTTKFFLAGVAGVLIVSGGLAALASGDSSPSIDYETVEGKLALANESPPSFTAPPIIDPEESPEPPSPPPNAGAVVPCVPGSTPFKPWEISCTTHYRDLRGHELIDIWGGASVSDPTLGILYVWTTDLSSGTDTTTTWDAPGGTGPLTLTRVTGNIVHFSFGEGQGTFDLAKSSFDMGA